MILREKVIIYLISFVIMIVAIDLLTFLILDDRNMYELAVNIPNKGYIYPIAEDIVVEIPGIYL